MSDKCAAMRKVTEEMKAAIGMHVACWEGSRWIPWQKEAWVIIESRALKLLVQPAVGACREPVLIRKTWC